MIERNYTSVSFKVSHIKTIKKSIQSLSGLMCCLIANERKSQFHLDVLGTHNILSAIESNQTIRSTNSKQ